MPWCAWKGGKFVAIVHTGGMGTKKQCLRKRCRSCRRWFRPHLSAVLSQRTCSLWCRIQRTRRLARLRREREIYQYRVEERQRQRECRARRREAARMETASAQMSRTTLSVQVTDLKELILKSWDRELCRSRARLSRQLKLLLRGNRQNLGQGGTKEPPCHVPP